MIIYYANLITTTVLNYSSKLIENKYVKRILQIIAIAIPSIIAGIRYNVGTDFNSYVEWFNMFLTLPLDFSKLNIGYNILIKIIQLFTSNPQLLFLVEAIIINTLIFLFIKDNTSRYELGYFLFFALYFYYSSLNITRQWIAIAISLYSLKYAFDAKIWKFLATVLVGMSFHITSVIMIPVYFLFKIKLKKKSIIILTICILTFIIVMNTFGVYIATKLELPQKYIDYLKFDSSLDSGGYAYLIFTAVTLFAIWKNYSKYIEKNEYGEHQIKVLIITFIVTALSINSMIFNRLQLYFIPMLMVCIPNIVNTISERKKQKAVIVAIILIGTIYMTRSLLINGGEPLPYTTIFCK